MFLSGSMAQRIQVISRHLQQKKAFEEKNGATRRLTSFEAGPHIVSTVIFEKKNPVSKIKPKSSWNEIEARGAIRPDLRP